MTIYIIKEDNPDLVKWYTDVLAVEVDTDKQELSLIHLDLDKAQTVFVVEDKVISIESN